MLSVQASSQTDFISISPSQQGRSSTDSRLPAYLDLQQHCSCDQGYKVMLGRGFLTAEMVDVLDSQKQDWIIELHPEQMLDLQGGETSHLNVEPILLKNRQQIAINLVAGIPLSSFQPFVVHEQLYWFVMFSCRVGGWGKVRVVVSCQTPLQPKSLLVTNRLDWSFSRVLKLFLQAHFSQRI